MRLVCARCSKSASRPFVDGAPQGSGDGRGICDGCALLNSQGIPEHRRFTKDFRQAESFTRYTSQRFVGVEFEMFHHAGTTDRCFDLSTDWRLENCGMVEDGSIHSDAGLEVQMPPAQGDDIDEWVRAICSISKEYGMKVDKSCGLHVHVDMRNDNRQGLRRLLHLVKAMEPVIYAMLPQARVQNHMCRPMGVTQLEIDAVRTNSDVWDIWRSRNNDGGSRYHGLNLEALEEHGSIEFRYHSGTLNPIKIRNWIKLCQSMMDHAFDAEYRQIPYKFTDFDERVKGLSSFLEIADLSPYLAQRIKHFGMDVAALTAQLKQDQEHLAVPIQQTPPMPSFQLGSETIRTACTSVLDDLWMILEAREDATHGHSFYSEEDGEEEIERFWCRLHSEYEDDLCNIGYAIEAGTAPPGHCDPGDLVPIVFSPGSRAIIGVCRNHGHSRWEIINGRECGAMINDAHNSLRRPGHNTSVRQGLESYMRIMGLSYMSSPERSTA